MRKKTPSLYGAVCDAMHVIERDMRKGARGILSRSLIMDGGQCTEEGGLQVTLYDNVERRCVELVVQQTKHLRATVNLDPQVLSELGLRARRGYQYQGFDPDTYGGSVTGRWVDPNALVQPTYRGAAAGAPTTAAEVAARQQEYLRRVSAAAQSKQMPGLNTRQQTQASEMRKIYDELWNRMAKDLLAEDGKK